jgi:hypothetical protein
LTSAFRGFHQDSFPTNWVCEAGVLQVRPAPSVNPPVEEFITTPAVLRSIPGASVDLITREKFKDFELDLEWKVARGANSGVLYGVSEETKETYWSGPEMQVNDDPNHPDGRTPNHSAGALYDLIAPGPNKRLKATGEWNQTRLISRNGHVEHWLNGEKILEYDWDSPVTRKIISESKFKDAPLFMKDRNGYIALQHHGDEVSFRNIRITRFQRSG